jgi:TRAP-type C4-dicarboxylate transport system permease small subunit
MIERFFKILDKVFNVLSAFLLGSMVIIIFLQVITRMLEISWSWTTEITQYFFVWVTFIAAYLGARKGRHIGVEIIQNRVPRVIGKGMSSLSSFIAASFYGLVFFYCIKLWSKFGVQSTPLLKWPMNFVYSGMMIGLASMSLYYAYLAFKVLFQRQDGLSKLALEESSNIMTKEVE